MITLALSKGRIFDETLPLLKQPPASRCWTTLKNRAS